MFPRPKLGVRGRHTDKLLTVGLSSTYTFFGPAFFATVAFQLITQRGLFPLHSMDITVTGRSPPLPRDVERVALWTLGEIGIVKRMDNVERLEIHRFW